jgi:hypothetical protein
MCIILEQCTFMGSQKPIHDDALLSLVQILAVLSSVSCNIGCSLGIKLIFVLHIV